MEVSFDRNLRLDRAESRGRSFLLGNKRAFSLSLPAAAGNSDALLHPHKWFGAYVYGRKFLEGHLVRASGRTLSRRVLTGFTMGLTSARRTYEVDGVPCEEEFFVPDGIQGFACSLSGDTEFTVEPELDMRLAIALKQSIDGYAVEELPNGALVSAALPTGRYDDLTEAFIEDGAQEEPVHLYAAIEVVGDEAWSELLPENRRSRRKAFRKDLLRQRHVTASGAEATDHAPLWNQSTSRVYAPVRLHLRGSGTVFYGFGASAEEALSQLRALRDNFLALQVQKGQTTREILDHAPFDTGSAAVDTAYAQVLTRLMDALVARHATADDTALDRPATMILAGNQYFHDSWKRDENIALGFLLSLGFYDLARDVIRDTWQLQDEVTGRLPQRIRAGEEPPYHSSDGTLWAALRLHQYWQATGDDSVLFEKLPMVALFFRRSLGRSVDGLLPSGRTNDPAYLWETWMDTPHTPRDGFPIEIQMLWIAVLRRYRPVVTRVDAALAEEMAAAEGAAWQALRRFNVRGIPADSLDEHLEARDLITPNPYFCFGVELDLGSEMEGTMRSLGRRQLAGRQGIVTLAPQDWSRVYSSEFLADRRNVRGRRMRSVGKFNYHRGVEWNWLARFFVEGELKYGEPEIAYRTYLRNQVEAVLERAGIGGISELYDLGGTRGPEFQAWSMSGFLESLHAFAGVRIDVPGRSISIEPQLPSSWPGLRVRKWYGRTPMDLTYQRQDGGYRLALSFPWGVPEAELEIGLTAPSGQAVDYVDLMLDGVLHPPGWRTEPIAGTKRAKARLAVPAAAEIELTVRLRRMAARAKKSA